MKEVMRDISFYCTFLFILLLIGTNPITAQSNGVSVESYEELKSEIDFTKTKRTLVPRHEFKPKEVEEKKPNSSFFDFSGISSILRLLAYALIVGLVIYILYLVFSNIKIEEKIDSDTSFASEIEDIEEIDPDLGLKEALAAGDFRLAIRMKFIKGLQSLVSKKVIKWTPEKTNRDYRREIKDIEERSTFREAALIYENIWFGNFPISSSDYIEYVPIFDKMIAQS